MRLLAAFPLDFARTSTVGLWEKALGLVSAAEKYGHTVLVAYLYHKEFFLTQGSRSIDQLRQDSAVAGVGGLYARHVGFWRKLKKVLAEENYDAAWVRSSLPTPWMLRALQAPHHPLYLEIPTYPTLPQFAHWPLLAQQLYAQQERRLVQLADAVLTPSYSGSKLYGTRHIRVENGVDHDRFAVIEPASSSAAGYHLVGLGQWGRVHGVDRILLALAELQDPDKVRVTLAGEGPALKDLRQLSDELRLNVSFLPAVDAQARLALLATADAGIGALASHRMNVEQDSPLKHRMYAAYGIPFIAGHRDIAFAEVDGVFRCADNDEPLHADDLLVWLDAMRKRRKQVASNLHKLARQYDYANTYHPFFNELKCSN